MKILAVGDFNGKFPKKYENIIKREKIDVVISDGDYPPFSIKKLFFKHVYGKENVDLWEVIGKKKYKTMRVKDLKAGENVFKKLNKLSIPVFTVLGNHDYPSNDIWDYKRKKSEWKFAEYEEFYLSNALKKYKNITRFDYKFIKFKGFVFIGARGHSISGRVKSKAYKKHRKKLEKLFKKFNKINKEGKVIFVSHNVPYNTKLDKVTAKYAHNLIKNRHVGSKMFRRIIDKFQPVLHIAGHVDEGMGKQKLGRTLAVNCGAIHDGHGAIIEITEKGKVNVKFLK